jgi:hypothetical protein
MALTTTYEVHPTIGIARVGPSPEHFVGPEPGRDRPPSYRDAGGRLLRQAARFRVFRCDRDGDGRLVDTAEVRPHDGRVRWTVHVLNAKGAASRFPPPNNLPPPQWPVRNPAVSDRSELVIDPGPRVLEGPGATAVLDGGSFLRRPVGLGELATDDGQALLVLGGAGLAQSVTPDGRRAPITHFANNDFWCDDVADGPVAADVTLDSGEVVHARPGWVVVGPPDFAPPVFNFVTLYDIAFQAAVDRGWLAIPARPSFIRHVQPVLSRAVGYSWVTRFGRDGHGLGGPGQFDARWAELADPARDPFIRERIVDRLRDPNRPAPASMPGTAMPRLHDETNSSLVLPLTRAQYAMLQSWAEGDFESDLDTPPAEDPLPEAVTRMALETCSGGAFFPGIEVGGVVKTASAYSEPFRLDPAALAPGSLTAGNAVPWQADFSACEFEDQAAIGWWPSQRPDEIFVDDTLEKLREWADGANTADEMIDHWHELGFVLPRTLPDGRQILLEQERVLPRPS